MSPHAFSNSNLPRQRPDTCPDMELTPTTSSPEIDLGASQELRLLRRENSELRARTEEADQLLEAAAASEEGWLERQREFELLLEEKSEVIRTLHQKVQDLQGGSAGDNLVRAEELQRQGRELDERRKQLDQDEETLMGQMREMEKSLSRDRAELSRQRNELQRLHADLQHEIEAASRDSALKERLSGLRRRHQEVFTASGPPSAAQLAASQPAAAPAPSPAPTPPGDPAKRTGIFRRIFFNNPQ